jgi:hypothetical protein
MIGYKINEGVVVFVELKAPLWNEMQTQEGKM